jgi:hypothetical protein
MSSTTLIPTAPLRFQLLRLRQAVASDSRFTDQELLDLLNEGYVSACQRAECLLSMVTLTFTAASNEVPLPLDHVRTVRVYQAGKKLEPISYQHSSQRLRGTYYQYEDVIGLSIGGDTSVLMLYARSPIRLGFDDVPEWGREWDHLLRHYVAWRCIIASGGAQTLRKALAERSAFDNGVRLLRHQSRRGWTSGVSRIRHVAETRGAPVAG